MGMPNNKVGYVFMAFIKEFKEDISFHKRFYCIEGKLKFFSLLFLPSIYLVFVYRVYSALWRLGGPFKLLAKFFWFLSYLIFSCDISVKSKIIGPIIFPHPLAIVIGEGVIMKGDNVIYQGVTLGQNNGCYPKVSNSIIYPNCVICGNLDLDDRKVSALSFLKG